MSEEKVRILICLQCQTLEELPGYEGPPEGDVLLTNLIEQHHTDRITGSTHVGNLVNVPKKAWDVESEREQILTQIREALHTGEAGLGSSFYSLKNTYQEDALKCFQKHLRNPACSDYMSSRMQLGVADDVKEAWKSVGKKRPKDFGRKEYLCSFCPVHSMVTAALRDKR